VVYGRDCLSPAAGRHTTTRAGSPPLTRAAVADDADWRLYHHHNLQPHYHFSPTLRCRCFLQRLRLPFAALSGWLPFLPARLATACACVPATFQTEAGMAGGVPTAFLSPSPVTLLQDLSCVPTLPALHASPSHLRRLYRRGMLERITTLPRPKPPYTCTCWFDVSPSPWFAGRTGPHCLGYYNNIHLLFSCGMFCCLVYRC